MYRSPNKQSSRKSPTPLRNQPVHSKSPNNSVPNANTLYFCHYRNAMYMGGIKSFKKDGRGILLHDSGLSVITSYFNDLMHGHNIFFSQHCLLSAQFVKGKITEAVYRTDGFLGFFHFNSESQLEGKCILLNYGNKTVTYANFKKGLMCDKREEGDFTLLNRVFDLGEFDFLIGRVHSRVMKYEFDKVNTIEGQKYGNKLTIGFEKGGLINGIGFTLVFRGTHGGYNPETHRSEDDFELKVIERGYMVNSQLNGFGQKWFKNGNLYIGEFKNGIFEGNGILRNVSKKNWVSGYFQKGNLVELIEYNNEGENKSQDRIVEALHERKTNWINNDVHLLPMELFDGHIERIIIGNPMAAIRSLEERKHEVLKKIQDNFICESNSLPSFLETARSNLNQIEKEANNNNNSSVKKFVNSFIPDLKKDGKSKPDQNTIYPEGNKFSQSRKILGSMRKIKIFDRSSSSDNYLKVDDGRSSRRTSRTPDKKKIFGQTATIGLRLMEGSRQNRQGSSRNPENTLALGQGSEEGNFMKQRGRSGVDMGGSEVSNVSQSKKGENKEAGKSKIFNYLQNKADEISPKFAYTKVDAGGDSDKRKWLEIEQTDP